MSKLVGGVTQEDASHVGLSADELAALQDDGDEINHDPSRAGKAEVEALERELKKGDDAPDPEGEAAEAEEAEKASARQAAEKAAAEEAARAKAEEAAQAKREAELAAMSAGDRAKVEAADKAAAEKAAADAAAAAKRPADEAEEPFVPSFNAKPVEDYEKKTGELDKRIEDAEVKFRAGDMTFDEFRKTEREVVNERRSLDEQRLKHELASENNEQMAEARWQWETTRFFREKASNEGLDYKAEGNRPLWAALDAEVKALAADDANASKPGPWFLEEAHKRVKAAFNLQVGAPAPKPAKDVKAAAAAAAAAARKAPAAPATLHGLPPASQDTETKGEFAHLEKLEGMELESALAGMSKVDADRYLAGA